MHDIEYQPYEEGNGTATDGKSPLALEGPDYSSIESIITLCVLAIILIIVVAICRVIAKQSQQSIEAQQSRHEAKRHWSRKQEDIEDHLKVLEYQKSESLEDSRRGERSEDLEAGPRGEEGSDAFSIRTSAECAICLNRFESGQKVCQASNTACIHKFHAECMVAWLLKHPECPICRQEYLSDSSSEPDEM